MKLINEREFSLRKLGSNEYDICSGKTLRTALNKGKMIDLIMNDFLREEQSMDELLKDLGLNDQKELAQFVIENPEHPISKQLLELYERLEQHKENNKNQ